MDCDACAFDVLPDELVLSVLRALGRVGDLARFGASCQRMHALASDDHLWRSVFATLARHPPVHLCFRDFDKNWRWLCGVYRFLASNPVGGTTAATVIEPLGSGGVVYSGDIYGLLMVWHGYGRAQWTRSYDDLVAMLDRSLHIGQRPESVLSCTMLCGTCKERRHAVTAASDGKAPSHPIARTAARSEILASSLISTYEGEWVHGMRQGCGLCTWTCGTSYDGHFDRNLPHGQGECVWPDGACYRGAWVAGEMDGHGVMTTVDGARYEGDWRQGKRQGRGVYSWPNGSSYNGDWADNQKHGHGTLVYSNGDTHVGSWVNNCADGHGMRSLTDGRRYRGEWAKGRPEGDGTATHTNGDEYWGVWHQGRLCGRCDGDPYYQAIVHKRDGHLHLCCRTDIEWDNLVPD
jgi:hypothetical protein